MLLERNCSLQTKEDYEKAKSLFKPLEKTATDFAEQHKLVIDKWYQGTTVLLREKSNINNLNFKAFGDK